MTDKEIRQALIELDVREDVRVDSWEADFIEKVAYKSAGPLSEKQRAKAAEILERYA